MTDLEPESDEAEGIYRAFQGANGWYCAWETDDGFHRQPMTQNLTEDEAEAEAQRRNADAEEAQYEEQAAEPHSWKPKG
jgi:hypothetical protein